MIIRKPYAFLIKYFKIIHIILFISMTFLLFKTRNIYMFFREYLLTGTYIYTENMVFQYVSEPSTAEYPRSPPYISSYCPKSSGAWCFA